MLQRLHSAVELVGVVSGRETEMITALMCALCWIGRNPFEIHIVNSVGHGGRRNTDRLVVQIFSLPLLNSGLCDFPEGMAWGLYHKKSCFSSFTFFFSHSVSFVSPFLTHVCCNQPGAQESKVRKSKVPQAPIPESIRIPAEALGYLGEKD